MRTISDVFIRHGMHGLPLSMHLTVRGVLAGLMRGFSTPVPLSARLLALWASRVYSVALFHRGCDVDSQSGRLHGVCRGTDTGRPHQRDRLAQQRRRASPCMSWGATGLTGLTADASAVRLQADGVRVSLLSEPNEETQPSYSWMCPCLSIRYLHQHVQRRRLRGWHVYRSAATVQLDICTSWGAMRA